MDVVLTILELLDDLADQNYNKLRNSVEIMLPKVQTHVNLAVKCIETDVD